MSFSFPYKKIYIFGPRDAGKTSFVIQLFNYFQLSVLPRPTIMRELGMLKLNLSHDEIATRSRDTLEIRENVTTNIIVSGGGRDPESTDHRNQLIQEAAESEKHDIIFIFELGGIKSKYYEDDMHLLLNQILTTFKYYDTLQGRRFLFLANKAEIVYERESNSADKKRNLLPLLAKAEEVLKRIFKDYDIKFDDEKAKNSIILEPSSTILGALEIPIFFKVYRKNVTIADWESYGLMGEYGKRQIVSEISKIKERDDELSEIIKLISDENIWNHCKRFIQNSLRATIKFIYGEKALKEHSETIKHFVEWFDKNFYKNLKSDDIIH